MVEGVFNRNRHCTGFRVAPDIPVDLEGIPSSVLSVDKNRTVRAFYYPLSRDEHLILSHVGHTSERMHLLAAGNGNSLETYLLGALR